MFPPNANVCILCWQIPGPSETRARKIAEFLGTDAFFAPVTDARDIDSIRKLVPKGAAVIAHADILARIFEATGGDMRDFARMGPHLFVHGFNRSAGHAALIRALSGGGLLGAEAPAETVFHVAKHQRDWCGQFTGLPVRGVDQTKDSVFQESSPRSEQATLIRVGSQPFLARVDQEGSQMFLSGSGELADLDQEVNSNEGMLPWFSRLVPLLMFLKGSLGSGAWHSDTSQACFIIDDPLLRPSYGFLQYTKLLEATRGLKFSSSIAFIPWNYRRSSEPTAKMFLAERALSLCVHGCDHTKAEFASTGLDLLRGKARLALDRMHEHTKRSGVPFDDVMVFPQGLFSVEAVKALAASGYLAAVNTDLCPSNGPQVLALRNLMDVAVREFADLPLFGRHYPIDPAEFAFDLFLGKPALAVAHHGYFQNGYEALATFVRRINDLDERLEWNNLAAICTSACLKKTTAEGEVHVRFYTDRFRLTNTEAQAQKYVVFQRRMPGSPVPSISVNNRICEVDQKGDSLAIAVSLEPGQVAEIRVHAEMAEAETAPWKASEAHNAGVLVRRLLCEVRDEYLETNRFLSGLLTGLRALRTKDKTSELRLPELKGDTKAVEELCR